MRSKESVRFLLASFCIFLSVSMTSGCGLLQIPYPRTLPEPIKQIVVVQEGTNQPIADSEVVIHANRHKNWMMSFSPMYGDEFRPPTETTIIIPVIPVEAGCFTPEPTKVWCRLHIWGLGPLGTTIYEDYPVTVYARAEGYAPVSATYWPERVFNIYDDERHTDRLFTPPIFDGDGTLTVFLRLKEVEQDDAKTESPPVDVEEEPDS